MGDPDADFVDCIEQGCLDPAEAFISHPQEFGAVFFSSGSFEGSLMKRGACRSLVSMFRPLFL